LIYDGTEAPNVRTSFVTNITGTALEAGTYTFQVSTQNWVGWSALSPSLTVNLAMKVDSTTISPYGGGMTTSNAGVSSFVQLKSIDETGALRTTGGDIYYLHLLDRCYLDNNFYCTESPDATNIL